MEGDISQSVFNFDIAELIIIFECKAEFINHFAMNHLEAAYWSLRKLRMETDSLLSRKYGKKLRILDIEKNEQEEELVGKEKLKSEKMMIDESLQDLENARLIFIKLRKPNAEQWGKFYLELESFYMKLCSVMKIHGIYFREGEDNQLAVLRR